MKRVFTIAIIFGCTVFSFAQGIQGSVAISGSAIIVTGHSVALTWNASQNAKSYNVYRGTATGGPYVQVASGITITTYIDTQVGHGQTLYYVATSVNGSQESGFSNETVATIP
jgi:fibronectin type 3 domain-containing protein